MLFTNPWFLWAFLPLTWLVHQSAWRLGPRAALSWLILASLVFYAMWDWALLPILFASIGLNHVWARRLQEQPSRFFLGAGILLNLSVLCYFKYAGFFSDNLDLFLGTNLGPVSILLPLGFSFITFQKIAYLVDAYRGETRHIQMLDFLALVTFFPQLVAGPIVHPREFVPQVQAPPDPVARRAMQEEGLLWLSVGLFKKVMLADALIPWANPIFDQSQAWSTSETWAGVLAYTLQLYLDFSAYSEMALGLGLLFGIRLPINFDAPYQAKNIADFWRRWHITLSRFLRDHIYIPLGGNRLGRTREASALMVTFLLGGLWHGAGWPFLLWGLLHGLYLVAQRLWAWAALPWPGGALGRLVAQGLTFAAVVWAWVPFRAPDLAATWRIWVAMLGGGGAEGQGAFVAATGMFTKHALGLELLLLVGCWCLPSVPRWLAGHTPDPKWRAVAVVLLLVALSGLGRPTSFLYWNF